MAEALLHGASSQGRTSVPELRHSGTPTRSWAGRCGPLAEHVAAPARSSGKGRSRITDTLHQLPGLFDPHIICRQVPLATLHVVGLGTMTWKSRDRRYERTIRVNANPGSVTVESSARGRATAAVSVQR